MRQNLFPILLGSAFLASLVLALVSTVLVRSWARAKGYVDYPGGRRAHQDPTPNVGGISVALSTMVVFVTWGFFLLPIEFQRPEMLSMLVGGLLVLLVGIRDDIEDLPAKLKFLLQWAIASLVFLGGVRILGTDLGGALAAEFPLWASYIVTVLWIVGATNAFNLIDGSDGIAGGAALFASSSLGIVFVLNGDPLGALMATILVGTCLGFLFFNFPPASIFLGDGGSLFLGYTLATLGVITTQKASTLLAMVIPLVAFAVPLLDTVIAVIRRFLRREPIFNPDRGHIHHRLRDLGHSPRGVALLLYSVFALFAVLSLLLAAGRGQLTVLPVFLVATVVLFTLVQRLKVPELMELGNVLGRGLQQRQVIAHNIRIRAAADALSTAHDASGLFDALKVAFEGSEFHRLELWLPPVQGAALWEGEGRKEGRVRPCGDGFLLSLRFMDHESPQKQEIEVQVPLWNGSDWRGRFSLYLNAGGERVYTDLRLLSKELSPGLATALDQLQPSHVPDEPTPRTTASLK